MQISVTEQKTKYFVGFFRQKSTRVCDRAKKRRNYANADPIDERLRAFTSGKKE